MERWVRRYERGAGCKFSLRPAETLVYDEEKGFLGYFFDVHALVLVVTKMVGDGKFWWNKLHELMIEAKPLGVTKVHCSSSRDSKAFLKFCRCKIYDTRVEDGKIINYYEYDMNEEVA